jgi:hypothetical protein
MYCIYSDTDVPSNLGNLDHVIPLSLGGANQFVVWSDMQKNSVIGSQVDGELAKDPLMSFALRNSGVKGHGKATHLPRWRHVTMDDGRPLQVTLGTEKITVWDARAKRELEEAEVVGRQMTAQLRVRQHTALRFVAKVALGGGYFLYGDDFRNGVNCNHLREIVFLDVERSRQAGTLQNSGIKVCDRFHSDSFGSGPAVLYRALCEGTQRSLFIAIPHDNAISFHVGIVGKYVGSMIIPAKTDTLPIDGVHDLGHAVVLGPGEMDRLSFRELVVDFNAAMDRGKAEAEKS